MDYTDCTCILKTYVYEAWSGYERPRRAVYGGKECYAGAMSRELRTYTFTVVVEPAADMWHAYCPTLLAYGAETLGDTREEVRGHIREVVGMIVERLAEEGASVPIAPADQEPVAGEQIVVTVCAPLEEDAPQPA